MRGLINRKLSLGAAHRAKWVPVPISERNAYVGSHLAVAGDNNSDSIGGGLRPEAIVKVELEPGSTKSYTLSTNPSKVGIKGATLTGMIKKSSLATETLSLVSDETFPSRDEELNKIDVAAFTIDPIDMVGAGADHYIPFKVTDVKYGRTYNNKATGPDGESDTSDNVLIGYNLNGVPKQSPPTELILPDYKLEPPHKTSFLKYELSGAIGVSGAGSGSQSVETRVYDKDALPKDDLMVIEKFKLTHPANAWDGVLIPYNTNVTFSIDSKGDVIGAQGSSHENPAQIYQRLIRPGIGTNPESSTVEVP